MKMKWGRDVKVDKSLTMKENFLLLDFGTLPLRGRAGAAGAK